MTREQVLALNACSMLYWNGKNLVFLVGKFKGYRVQDVPDKAYLWWVACKVSWAREILKAFDSELLAQAKEVHYHKRTGRYDYIYGCFSETYNDLPDDSLWGDIGDLSQW